MRFLLVLMLVVLAGCSTDRRGDARLTTSVPFMGRKGDRNFAVEFPRFPIDKPGEFRWRARGLPPADFRYTLNLRLPRLDSAAGDREADAGREPAWRDLEIRFSAHRSDGSLIATQTYRPGDSIAQSGWPDDTTFKFSLASLRLERLQDYDLLVTILTPSRKRADAAQIRGWRPGYNPRDQPVD